MTTSNATNDWWDVRCTLSLIIVPLYVVTGLFNTPWFRGPVLQVLGVNRSAIMVLDFFVNPDNVSLRFYVGTMLLLVLNLVSIRRRMLWYVCTVTVVTVAAESLSLGPACVPFGCYSFALQPPPTSLQHGFTSTELHHMAWSVLPGPQVVPGLPGMVPLMWMALVWPVWCTAVALLPSPPSLTPCWVLAAALLVAHDLASDPLMASLGGSEQWRYDAAVEKPRVLLTHQPWKWHQHNHATYLGVPWTNFAGWFVVGCVVFFLCDRLRVHEARLPAQRWWSAGTCVFANACTGLFYATHSVHPVQVRAMAALTIVLPAAVALWGIMVTRNPWKEKNTTNA